jgi:hypothetical protein
MDPTDTLESLTDLRDRTLERVRQVNKTTEDGVLAAGNQLQAVVGIAREHINQLHDLLVQTRDSALHQAIASQAEHARRHGTLLDETVAHHAGEVANVATSAGEIAAAAREIERANSAARMLAMNARIESSRSGSHVFKAIATEMTALSRAIVSANGRIQQLATAMEVTLPKLVAETEALRAMVSNYTIEAREQIDHVDRETTMLKANVEGNLQASDGALAQIISASHSGLSALQFQDVCAQSLLQMDAWHHQVLTEIAEESEADIEIAPAVTAISTEDGILEHATSGEVMLF